MSIRYYDELQGALHTVLVRFPNIQPETRQKCSPRLTIENVGRNGGADEKREELYRIAVRDFGRALDRLAAGYESDPAKREDLRQEIHLQLWRSFELFDGRCSVKTWIFRVAHNTGVAYVYKEQRRNTTFTRLDEIEATIFSDINESSLDRDRQLQHLFQLILCLKPIDRQIMISYLEGMDAASIAEISGVSAANVATKIHRVKKLLSRRFLEEKPHV